MIGRRGILAGFAAAIAVVGGMGVRRLFETEPHVVSESAELYQLVLPDLMGQPQHLSQWKGKILVANFWATWCEPCREEIPAMVKIQAKYASKSVQFVGISIDSVDKIQQFATSFRINYPLLIGGLESLALLRSMGNQAGVLPFTAVLRQDGSLVQSHMGAIAEGQLDNLLKTLIS